jgi:hypothetical protein
MFIKRIKKRKKHSSDFSPYHFKLIPIEPVDGADTRYGQLYKPITVHPFKEAGIEGFSPLKPYQVTSNLALTNRCLRFHWPSLSELNEEVTPFQWEKDDEYPHYIKGDFITMLPILTTRPPPATPTHPFPMVPSIPLLVAAIVQSTDRLFFVSYKICNNNAQEWCLAQVAFMDSMPLHPSCTFDSQFLF